MYNEQEIRTLQKNSIFQIRIEIFPNPTNGNVKIRSVYPLENITLYDEFGRVVNTNVIPSEIEIQIETASLSSGIYYIEYVVKGLIFREKIVKID